MWYYTGKGDQGDSSLFDGRQVSKGDIVFELIGTLDEATAHLGMAVSLCRVPGLKADLRETQDYLSKLMGTIADLEKAELEGHSFLARAIGWLEKKISDYGKLVKNPQAFLYAGESALGAAIDVSRTVIRRTERIAVRYFGAGNDDGREILVYLNRLSSLLYILRLYADSSIK
ncbi:MAG: cob(I)yrinic acid a,c-diamide adenosyltransferase [Pelolinea sp.]|nr:cob(I)yrinic acid a,c-diamide adenosyltransferase [Pelolinea sp.]